MAEKADLTLEDALAEFPKECEAIAEDAMIECWLEHSLSIGWAMLVAAALRWLAGKETSGPPRYLFPHHRAIGSRHSWHWPDNPLRWLLEEVRTQLKAEKEDVR